MKKIVILSAIIMVFSCGVAFAAYDADTKTCGTSPNSLDIQLSNKVSMEYTEATTGDGLGYVIGASHSSGTRTYGSSSGDAKIFWTESLQATLPAAPTGTASAGFTWTAL